MIKGTLINKNEKIKTIMIDLNNLTEHTKYKGYGDIQLIYTWNLENNMNINIYGWKNGSYDIVNKHELPAPLEYTLLYGDIIFLMKVDSSFVNFTSNDYNKFYEDMFGGFDDCNSSDDEIDVDDSDDDYDYTDGFLVKD